jgi:hypothetical protein
MPAFPYSIIAAGPADVALAIVVLGTMMIALIVNMLGLISWLRRRP